MEVTEIQNFYKNKTIFITGSTGLVGKVLVEKLLRSCSELNKIILTMRPKKKASAKDRILDFFNNTLFDTIKNTKPEIMNKVIFLITNVEDNYCGLNDTDYDFVKSSVNIIFHCAATVEFNGPLKDAINSNIKITKNIIDIAKNMNDLQAFVHVSTCWVHGYLKYTKEIVVNFTYEPEFFTNLVDTHTDEELLSKTPTLLENWPNTYLLTKNVTEYQIEREKENLPVTIFRAPGVTPTYQEPFPGWINSVQAITAVGIGLATGTLKVVCTDPEYNLHIVPVDLIANCMIVVAWNTAKNKEFKVYNYSCVTNPILRKKYYDFFTNTPYPLENIIWTPGYVTTSNKWLFDRYFSIYHTLPATICDTILKILGQKPVHEIRISMISISYNKIIGRSKKLMNAGGFFLSYDLKFEFKNVPALWNSLKVEDQKLFNFDVNSVDWDKYLNVCTKSTKILLNEDFNNLDKCEAKRYL